MASFNKIVIVGYLGADPEIRYTPQGKAVCGFRIATTERKKDNTGEYQDQTTWFKITCWDRQAEAANQYLTKGKQVYVEGRLKMTEYTDREGQKRNALEVSASDIQFLGSRSESGNAGPSADEAAFERKQAQGKAAFGAQAPGNRASGNAGMDLDGPTDSDIPF